MTTIAYRDGVLAADSQVTANGRVVGSAQKARSVGPLLAGASGLLGVAEQFLDWLASGAKGDAPKMEAADSDAEAFVVMPDGLIVTWDKYGCDTMRAPFYAIGSGASVALGAMAAGASAEDAVRAAAAIDIYTGGAIRVFRRPSGAQ